MVEVENMGGKDDLRSFLRSVVQNRPVGRSPKIDRDRPTSTDREHYAGISLTDKINRQLNEQNSNYLFSWMITQFHSAT